MDNDVMRALEARMRAQDKRVIILQAQVATLQETLEANTKAIQEFIDISKGLKVGLKLLSLVESAAIWVTKIVVAFSVVWGTWKFLVKEAIAQAARLR